MKNRLNNSELKREIGLFSATVLVIANMVGMGIFTTSGFIIQELGKPQTMLLFWFVGGVFVLSKSTNHRSRSPMTQKPLYII